MKKVRYIFIGIFVLAAFAFGQKADTSTAAIPLQQQTNIVKQTSPILKKQTGTIPTTPEKPPTNWSKIKDLFL